MNKEYKVGLDVDSVCAFFTKGFYDWFNQPFIAPNKWEDEFIITNFKKIVDVPAFWLSLEVLSDPKDIDFDVFCYVTARPIASHITYKWLIDNGFPDRPVFTVGSSGDKHNTKTDVINTLGITHFCDDHIVHVLDINKNTDCTCFCFTQPHNESLLCEPRINNFSELKQYL